MRQLALRTVPDAEVLDGMGMAILETAEGYSPQIDLPATADDLQRVRSCPALLFEPVKRKLARRKRLCVRQFFDEKVGRELLEFHRAT